MVEVAAAGAPIGGPDTVLLVGVAAEPPDELPDGALGAPRVLTLPDADGPPRAIVVVDADTDWRTAPLDDVTWVVPRALHHDEILRACVDQHVLPVRLGVAFADDETALAAIEAGREHYTEQLARLAGAHEYRLVVTPARRAREHGASGADYLRRRAAELRQADDLVPRLDELLLATAREFTVTERRPERISLAVLAEPHRWLRCLDDVAEIVSSVEWEGPLPPFHFVEPGDATDA